MRRRLVLFDIDGTLIDSRRVILEAQARAFRSLGLPVPSDAAILATVGLSLDETFRALAGADGPRAALAERYKSEVRDLRADPAWGEPAYPGVEATLRALAGRADLVLGIATGRARRGLAPLFAARGWEGLFPVTVCGDEHPSKPDPAMLRAAAAEAGVAMADALFVGDSVHDAAMATAAAMPFVAVSWGFERVEVLRGIGAIAALERFEDVLTLVPEAGLAS